MAYSDWVNYFRTLSEEHSQVQHTSSAKKFYRMDIEELLQGIPHKLPAPDEGPFLIFINYLEDVGKEPVSPEMENKQFMIQFLQGYKTNDWDAEEAARDNCETVWKQFLARMQHDSQNGNGPFKYGFDRKNARAVPVSVKANITYVGWQVTFNIGTPFEVCYEPNHWGL